MLFNGSHLTKHSDLFSICRKGTKFTSFFIPPLNLFRLYFAFSGSLARTKAEDVGWLHFQCFFEFGLSDSWSWVVASFERLRPISSSFCQTASSGRGQ